MFAVPAELTVEATFPNLPIYSCEPKTRPASIMPTGKNDKKRKSHRRKWRPLDEALRREGLDEVGYAQTLGGFFEQLEGNTAVTKLKLKLDGLKELSRHLEPKRSAASVSDDVPMMVQLVHNVARPPRTDAPEAREADDGPDNALPE